MSQTPRSDALFKRAAALMPGGVSSPVRAFRGVGGTPRFVARAEGAWIFDEDGRRYVDLVGSWGTAIVGHAHPAVVESVNRAARDGLSFGACCAAEADLAELILAAFPPSPRGESQQLRFVNSGTEATMSAVRLARAVTHRRKVLKFNGCYHGHVDSLLVAAGSGAATLATPDSAGVTPSAAADTLLAEFNDLSAVEELANRHADDLAAILVEPIAGNMGMVMPEAGFLEGLRAICARIGALLIFDEVMTGFRVAWGGWQTHCGVQPDITCLGKVIGGGMPVAAYMASAAIMANVSPLGPMYQAGTLSGNPIGMAAGLATLTLCRRDGFYDELDAASRFLVTELAARAHAAGVPIQTLSQGGMAGFFFAASAVHSYRDARACDPTRFARFFHAMLDRGVWLPPSAFEAIFLSSAHTREHLDLIIGAADACFRELH